MSAVETDPLPAANSTAAVSAGREPPVALAMTLPREQTARMLRAQIDRGAAIRRQRVRYVEDLEEVRARKSEWVQAYTAVLGQLFTTGVVADECNDWVGRVYPEYADTTLFVEQFYQEMDHRLRRLRTVLKKLPTIAEPVRVVQRLEASSGAGGSAETNGAPASAAGADSTPPAAGSAAAASEPAQPVVIEPPAKGLLVVHPGAGAAAAAVGQFLQELGVSVAAFNEPPQGAGGGAVETFEQEPDASFAVVLLSPEEAPAFTPLSADPGFGSPVASPPPEVLFQLGYFVGRLGLKRVCVVCPRGGGVFSDGRGVSHIPIDSADGWQLHLARHLRRAGVEVDLNRLF